MKKNIRKFGLGGLALTLFFGVSTSPALADSGRHGGWHRRAPEGRVWVRAPYRVRYYRPIVSIHETPAYYYDENEPGWSIRFDSDGDIGFRAEW